MGDELNMETRVDQTPAWQDPLVQATVEMLRNMPNPFIDPEDGEEGEYISKDELVDVYIEAVAPVAKVLMAHDSYDPETLAALLFDQADMTMLAEDIIEKDLDIADLSLTNPDHPRFLRGMIELSAYENIRGVNALYTQQFFPMLKVRYAEMIADTEETLSEEFNLATKKEKKDFFDRMLDLGDEMKDHVDRIELTRMWERAPKSLLRAFYDAVEKVADKLMNEDLQLAMSLVTAKASLEGALKEDGSAVMPAFKALRGLRGPSSFSAS